MKRSAEKTAMWVLIGIFCALVLSWPVGLYISAKKTDRIAAELYQWIHDDPSLTSDRSDEEAEETAAQLVARFEIADLPFKKFVSLNDGWLTASPIPSPCFETEIGASSNGSSWSRVVTPISTFYIAAIRTQREPSERTNGTVVIVVETSLFGL